MEHSRRFMSKTRLRLGTDVTLLHCRCLAVVTPFRRQCLKLAAGLWVKAGTLLVADEEFTDGHNFALSFEAQSDPLFFLFSTAESGIQA